MLQGKELQDYIWSRRNLCILRCVERMVYDAPRPYLHFDRLALIHEDGTVLYEGSTQNGDTFHSVSHMQHQIVMQA